MKTTNKKGFTLVELIVVIAIIGILAAVLFPTITGYMDNAKESAAMQEAETIKSTYETWLIEKETSNITFEVYVVNLEVLKSDEVSATTSDATATPKKLEPLTGGYEKGFTFIASNKKVVIGTFANGRLTLALK